MSEAKGKMYGDRWRVVRIIGKGGQGVVYEVEDVSTVPPELVTVKTFRTALRSAIDTAHHQKADEPARELMEVIKRLLPSTSLPHAALKELLPIDEAVNAATAIARMKEELEALKAVEHPSLVKVLDDDLSQRWFVTEYFANGPFGARLDRYRRNVLKALEAFRPVVAAVAELHHAGIVHRDIKPDNVFIADDGHLVLGDCGLAIKLEKQDRLTLTFENVGTRDYQPPWSYGMRLQDVKPTFDVFSLGKLLWAMVSGRPRFPLWYIDQESHDLRKICPDTNSRFVHRILAGSVVQWEAQLKFGNAGELLEVVDETLAAVSAGGQLPTEKRPMRCRFCGLGEYALVDTFQAVGNVNTNMSREYFACNNCGHLESFIWRGDRPPAWEE